MTKGLNSLVPGLKGFKIGTGDIDPTLVVHQRGSIWYVAPQDAAADDTRLAGDNGKSWDHPFKTMAAAFAKLNSGDIILFAGNVAEELTTPANVFDVSIIGVANRARHADDARDAIGARAMGATWRQAASHGATTPLLKIQRQGWRLENFLFAPPSDAAAVYLDRNALSGTSEHDASHAELVKIRFDGGARGIDDNGCYDVLLEDCIFRGNTTAVASANPNAGVANPLMWMVRGCHFSDNTNHFVLPASKFAIVDNIFGKFTTASIDLTGSGGNNVLARNVFFGTFSIGGGYTKAAASDEWGGNYNSIAGGLTASDPA